MNNTEELKNEAYDEIMKCHSRNELFETKSRYIGRKGKISELMKALGKIPEEERPAYGMQVNEVRQFIEKTFGDKLNEINVQEYESGCNIAGPPEKSRKLPYNDKSAKGNRGCIRFDGFQNC